MANAVLLVMGTGSFKFYPRVSAIEWLWGYVTYALMLGLPFLVELERLKR